jgi:hypothetical protein
MLKRKGAGLITIDVALLITILLASKAAAFSPSVPNYSFDTRTTQIFTTR